MIFYPELPTDHVSSFCAQLRTRLFPTISPSTRHIAARFPRRARRSHHRSSRSSDHVPQQAQRSGSAIAIALSSTLRFGFSFAQ